MAFNTRANSGGGHGAMRCGGVKRSEEDFDRRGKLTRKLKRMELETTYSTVRGEVRYDSVLITEFCKAAARYALLKMQSNRNFV